MSTKVEKVRAQAAPRIAEARQTLTDDVLPAVQNALSEARDQVTPLAEEAFRRSHEAAVRGHEAAAAHTPQGARSRGRKKWVVLLGLAATAAAATVAARKVLDGRSTAPLHDTHQSTMRPSVPTVPTQPGSAPDSGDDLLEPSGRTPTDQDLLGPAN